MALFSRGRNPNIQAYTIEIRGAKPTFAGDWYHLMLRAPWWFDVLLISAGFLLVNVLFALAYLATGGIVGVHSDSFADLFFFSVQTMSTVGYGSMYPTTTSAHLLTTAESIAGIF